MKLYEDNLGFDVGFFPFTVRNEIILWLQVSVKGGLIECDIFLSAPRWFQIIW